MYGNQAVVECGCRGALLVCSSVTRDVAHKAGNSLVIHACPQYVCLLDIANAVPRTPHAVILRALSRIGARRQLLKLIEKMYQRP